MKAFRNLAALVAMALASLLAPSISQAVSSNIVIVEVYGAGGNSGSVYKNDYVGLFNLGTSNVDVNGWSVQYASATGASWNVSPLATSSKIIPPGGYFLVQETNGSGGTTSLPAPDATGALSLSGTSGKVALVNTTTALTSAAATGPTIVDFVGFGTATTFEGSGPTAVLAATTSAQRNNAGCVDTDNNASDFTVATCNPRNSGTPIHSCAVVTPPTISGVNPGGLTTNAGNNVSFTVTLSAGDTPLSYFWYKQASTTTLIPSATTATLTLTNVTAADAASYFVVVSNTSTVNATSGPVTLGVNDPAINGQPLTSQTLLLGSTARIIVNAAGSSPLGYQWFSGAPGLGTALVDDGRIVGSTNSTLIISNLNAGDANTYYLVFSNTLGTLTSSTFNLSVVSTGGTIAFWDFNTSFDTNNPASTVGYGTGNVVNLNDTFALSAAFGDANDDATDNGGNSLAWGTANYPANTVSNLQAGVGFAVSTVGAKNIKGSYDVRETSASSKYFRLQYTTNGTDYTNYPASFAFTSAASSFAPRPFTFDLTGFPGVANNPNFGIRLVAEFESTATYGVSNTASYIGVSATYSGSGTVSFDLVNLTGDAISGAYNPPTIGAIANQLFSIANSGSATVTASGAGPLTITAVSLDHTILSDPSVSGTTLTLSGVAVGVAPVVVTVTDANGNSTSTSFQVTVTALNVAPTVVGLHATNIVVGTPLSYAFNVSDDHTAPASLTFAVSSGNTSLVPSTGVVLGGSGTNRTLTITPVAGATGVAPITVSVGDNDASPLTNNVSFAVMILPSTNVLLIDGFDYNGTNFIDTISAGLWVNHSGSNFQLTVGGGVATIDGVHNSEDVHALLIGQPYSSNSAVVLYSSFTLNYKTLPSVGGSYMAHFRDENSGAATGFGARVWASALNAATNAYRIGIGNGVEATNTSGQFPLDLSPSNNYTIVTRYVESNGVSTIWVNPTSESSQSVTATDMPTTNDSAPNAINVTSYAMRESNSDEGICTLDNLKVGLHFADVVAVVPTAPSVAIAENGTNIVVSWSDATYSLQSSTNAATGYTTISGATSPYTNASSASATFYRLVK